MSGQAANQSISQAKAAMMSVQHPCSHANDNGAGRKSVETGRKITRMKPRGK
jgi:hypothetical protein